MLEVSQPSVLLKQPESNNSKDVSLSSNPHELVEIDTVDQNDSEYLWIMQKQNISKIDDIKTLNHHKSSDRTTQV